MTTETTALNTRKHRRTLTRQRRINPETLPPEPDLARLPRLATREQLSVIHERYYGPLSPRTIEALPLPYRRPPGSPALYEVGPFLEWARRRFEAAPVLMGGRGRRNASSEPGPTTARTEPARNQTSDVSTPEVDQVPSVGQTF